ncbi:DUF362 domain-containing protein [Magnetovirga frankeli]|uniref:DUF362 domain-containing protein n=1 Tax=Magnetovirga frankeli TaxID=947516 RepID=UPI0012940B92|nr:DUF362 domain-containing protein [gamma proteobacterium SS-5]
MARRDKPQYKRTLAPRTRREFLRDLGATALVAGGFTALGLSSYSQDPVREQIIQADPLKGFVLPPSQSLAQLSVVRGSQVEPMVREALQLLGGMQRFIAKGDRVLIKPNIGWDRQPEQAANTNPEVVAALVRLCREAGAGEIIVSDVSLNDPKRCFVRSGIQQAAQEAGARVELPGGNDFIDTDMQGQLLKIWPVAKHYHWADKLINVPIVKHHSLCGCTLGMKNLYGAIGGRRNQLHQDIHTSIVDLAAAVTPTLTVMDAVRVLKHNGPTGGSLDDVARENTIIAGVDPVAIDSYSLRFLDLKPEQVPFLAMAEARGLGLVDWRQLRVKESQIG